MMQIRNRLIVLTAGSTVLAFFGAIPPARAQTLADISARATKTTIYVEVGYVDKNTGTEKVDTIGSGFVIAADGTAVTAYHVLVDWLGQDDDGKARNPIMVRIGSKYAPKREAAYVTGDQQSDIAVLRILEPQTYAAAPVCYPSSMQSGAYVFGFGFPNGHDLTPVPGTYSNPNGKDNRWEAAAAYTNGMSGGPVYDDRGFVVGLVQGGVPLTPATSYVTPLRWARNLVESHTSVKQACFGTCRAASNPIERWTSVVPWSAKSEWMGGGHDRGVECGKLQALFMQAHPGQVVDVTHTDEVNDKDFLGHVTYQYACDGALKSGPIYSERESPDCPAP